MLNRGEGFGVVRAVVLSAAALGVLVPACASDKMGTAGEDCYPNGTCNETLVCKAGKCVADSGGTGTGGAGGHATTTSSSSSTTSSSGTGGGTTSSSSSTSASSSTGTGGGTTSSSSSSTSSSSSGASGNAPPQILVLGTNVPSITEGETVTFTAVVTDPDGIDDVIGGTLSDGNGHYYGAFATTGQEGAYQLNVSWGQINQVQAINLAMAATTTRNFTAEFFDQGGHNVQQSVSITLGCKAIAACDGTCIDLSTDSDNCGACGQACGGGVPCYKSHCAALGNCNGAFGNCTQVCASAGKTCADKCGPGNVYGGVSYTQTACGGTASNILCSTNISTLPASKCCCF